MNHSRYLEIGIKPCIHYKSERLESLLKIVLFKNDKNLRSHTIKHFANLLEFEKIWRRYVPKGINENVITSSASAIKDIGCPYFNLSLNTPPCHHCTIFDLCNEHIKELESLYLSCLEKVLQEGGNIPRYAHFLSKRHDNEMIYLMPESAVIAIASILKNDIYNLSTCYVKPNTRLNEMRDREIQKIKDEASLNTIAWCNELGWGIQSFIDKIDLPERVNKKTNKKRQKAKPFRGGGQTWRQYLDEPEDCNMG